MSITPEELPALFLGIQAKAAKTAPDIVMQISRVYESHVQALLYRRAHPMGTWTDAPPGEPPSMITGELARSITITPGVSTGTFARATVAPHTVYASVQEWGRDITARRKHFLHWGTTYVREVHIPPRPYMRPALTNAIADGSLTRAAEGSFMRAVW